MLAQPVSGLAEFLQAHFQASLQRALQKPPLHSLHERATLSSEAESRDGGGTADSE